MFTSLHPKNLRKNYIKLYVQACCLDSRASNQQQQFGGKWPLNSRWPKSAIYSQHTACTFKDKKFQYCASCDRIWVVCNHQTLDSEPVVNLCFVQSTECVKRPGNEFLHSAGRDKFSAVCMREKKFTLFTELWCELGATFNTNNNLCCVSSIEVIKKCAPKKSREQNTFKTTLIFKTKTQEEGIWKSTLLWWCGEGAMHFFANGDQLDIPLILLMLSTLEDIHFLLHGITVSRC